ncbi:lactosylceramide 4-alpha-galactosyltransferase-like [Penaeus monodon]|uniref:lactosylceramide 4-alpha-galactosyltransferase-like n=1 Tax=Penaeus monodon TaxID=6687 RepID=UPI0018A7DE42|nr:lactosylceramide 4-alpha-galactosyltransferase-like [Penaeus monodon]
MLCKEEAGFIKSLRVVRNNVTNSRHADGLPARLLERYSNLYVVTTDLETVFKNTSLEDFFMSGLWHKGTPWPIIQLSDILRVALVWRFGGFYTDIDTVCLKDIFPLQNFVIGGHYPRNQIATERFTSCTTIRSWRT